MREFCGLVVRCGLEAPYAACAPPAPKGVDGVDYDARRCGPARELAARGVDPVDPEAFRVYRFLGQRYQVVYEFKDTLALSTARLTFLLDDLPLAARLLSHFQKSRYGAEYLDADRRRFRGSREKTLSAEAERIAGSAGEGRLAYFGWGTSSLGPWRLSGRGLTLLAYAPAAAGTAYTITVVVSPENGAINLLMKMGLFRRLVAGHIRDLLDDVAEAGGKLQTGGAAGIERAPDWSPEERLKLGAFLALP